MLCVYVCKHYNHGVRVTYIHVQIELLFSFFPLISPWPIETSSLPRTGLQSNVWELVLEPTRAPV